MVDLNKEIYNILKGIALVEQEFPSVESENFPIITINEITNVGDFDVDEREILSEITFQIDVWDNGPTLERVNQIASEISKCMYKNHYKRTLGRGFTDPSGLKRNMMYFKIKVINLKETD